MTAKPSPGGIDDRPMAEINVTPFTDVLLVLLIIFMLLSAIATPAGFQKSFATRPTGPRTTIDDRLDIFVTIASASRFAIDGRAVTRPQLAQAMAREVVLHRSDPAHYSLHISIAAPESVPYQAVIDVLDAGRTAGDDDVGLVVSGR